MLDYLLLSNKSTITVTDKDGEEVKCKDLLQPVAIYTNIPPEDVIMVEKDYIARPDLISLAVYGDDRYADLICKYNGISNPFELNENMIILIPPLERMNEMFVANAMHSTVINNDSAEDNTFIPQQHPFQKQKNEKRSPAESVVGETNYVIDHSLGVIFY